MNNYYIQLIILLEIIVIVILYFNLIPAIKETNKRNHLKNELFKLIRLYNLCVIKVIEIKNIYNKFGETLPLDQFSDFIKLIDTSIKKYNSKGFDYITLKNLDLNPENIIYPKEHFLIRWLFEDMNTIPCEKLDQTICRIKNSYKQLELEYNAIVKNLNNLNYSVNPGVINYEHLIDTEIQYYNYLKIEAERFILCINRLDFIYTY